MLMLILTLIVIFFVGMAWGYGLHAMMIANHRPGGQIDGGDHEARRQ